MSQYLCPHCGGELVPDPNNQGKLLCYTDKERFDEAKLIAGAYGAAPVAGDVEQPAYDPYSVQQPLQTQQPLCTEQESPAGHEGGYNPYAPTQQPQYAQQPQTYPSQQPSPYGVAVPPKPKGLAIAALVVGILALLGSWVPLINFVNVVMGIVAIVLGAVAISRVNKGIADGKGMAIGGIVTGALTIVLSIALSALVMVGIANSNNPGGGFTYTYNYTGPSGTQNYSSNSSNTDDSIAYTSNASSNFKGVETFSLDGKEYKRDGVTVEQFLKDHPQYSLDAPKNSISSGYKNLINLKAPKNDGISVIMYLTVHNETDKSLPVEECLVTGISLDAIGVKDDYTKVPQVKINGIEVGGDFQSAIDKLGEPNTTGSYGVEYEYNTSKWSDFLEITKDKNGKIQKLASSSYK